MPTTALAFRWPASVASTAGVITKRTSETVAQRARALRMEYVYMGQDYKIRAVREIMQRGSFTLDQIAYVGDDVIDLPVMRVCGLAIAVANARDQVKAAAHYVTPNPGGEGAGRDAIDFILQAHGILDQCIEEYIDERTRARRPAVSTTARWRMLSLWVER